jgi:hypothetical protein
MGDRKGRIQAVWGLCAALALAAGQAAPAEPNIKTFSAGLSFENFSRTVIWKGDAASSGIQASLIAARAEFGFTKGLVASLSAGLALTDFRTLAFTGLPVSLAYEGTPILGFTLGAEVVAPIHKLSDFEISGTGRVVYCFGMSRTWPLEGFAVEGEAMGRSSWLEAAAGPRVTYRLSGPVIPYIEVSVRWLRADFEMTETLGDLQGTEAKHVSGDLSFGAALGADAALTDRLAVKAKAGIVPRGGGMDRLLSVGLQYRF